MKAKRHASHNDTPDKVASGEPREGRNPASCATLSTATSKARCFPCVSRTTRIPDNDSTSPAWIADFGTISSSPRLVVRNICLAEWTMTSLRSGKNSREVIADCSLAGTSTLSPIDCPSVKALTGQGLGCGHCLRVCTSSSLQALGEAASPTGKFNNRSALPGTQIRSHASQSTCALSGTASPANDAGGVISAMRKIPCG